MIKQPYITIFLNGSPTSVIPIGSPLLRWIIGQSNAGGNIATASKPSRLNGPFPNIQMLYSPDDITFDYQASDPPNNAAHVSPNRRFIYNPGGSQNVAFGDSYGWGSLDEMLHIRSQQEGLLFAFNSSQGGKQSNGWAVGGDMRDWFDDQIQYAISEAAVLGYPNLQSSSSLRLQGESDLEIGRIENLEANTSSFISHVKTKTGVSPNHKFLIGLLHPSIYPSTLNGDGTYKADFICMANEAFLNIAANDPNVYAVAPWMIGVTLQGDNLHIDANGALKYAEEWDKIERGIGTAHPIELRSAWDEEKALFAQGLDLAAIVSAVKARYGGSKHGGTKVALPEPDWVNDPHITTPYSKIFEIEDTKFQCQRLSRFDNTDPVNGDAKSLRSERTISCEKDGNGDWLFFEKHAGNNIIVYRLKHQFRRAEYVREHSIANLSSEEKEWIHPHPSDANSVICPKGTLIQSRNIITDSEATIVNLGFTPYLGARSRDGNGVRNNCICIGKAESGHDDYFILDLSNGEAVTMDASKNRITVPVASRDTVSLPNNSDLDFVWTDGTFIYAVHRSGTGPDGGSGMYVYEPTGTWTGIKLFPGTGHYGMQGSSSYRGSIISKISGNTSLFPGMDNPGDHFCKEFDVTWNGSVWQLSENVIQVLDNTYGFNPPIGGQHSGRWDIDDVSYMGLKAAFTSTTETLPNKILTPFWPKEGLLEMDLDQANNWRQIKRGLTARNSPTNYQYELNFIGVGDDGTRYVVDYTRIGPADGDPDSSDVLTNKDMYLNILPPRMPDARIAYYLSQ